jgi:2-oxoglutarate ferredoxin oxidoreductase subunit delta
MVERARNRNPEDPSATDEGHPAAPAKLPVFDYGRCKACGICAHFCPRLALEEGPGGYPQVSKPEACNACRQCERLCPDFAVELHEQAEQNPPSEGSREVCDPFLACEE